MYLTAIEYALLVSSEKKWFKKNEAFHKIFDELFRGYLSEWDKIISNLKYTRG
jgi:hypothetical protein